MYGGIGMSASSLHRESTDSLISIKIIKNEVGCRDDTVPKTGDTRRHCEVELTIFRNPQKTRCREGGCGRLLHTVNSTSQCLLVSPVTNCLKYIARVIYGKRKKRDFLHLLFLPFLFFFKRPSTKLGQLQAIKIIQSRLDTVRT